MDLGIKDKVAIVTGGSRGLGRQAALSLAREGVKVAISGRTEATLNDTVRELQSLGSKAIGIVADITDPDSSQNLYDRTLKGLGPVDILTNNAGGRQGGPDLDETTEEDFKKTMDLNLYGALRMIRLVVPHMKEQKWGRIINIASIWGREHGGVISYMPAKAALIAATKHLSRELAKYSVLVNSVAPGSIKHSGGTWERFSIEQPPEIVEKFIEENFPMGRFGWPEPVGDLVAFLASTRASLITGTCINIDGGQSKSLI